LLRVRVSTTDELSAFHDGLEASSYIGNFTSHIVLGVYNAA
jgi:hypothetical protein